MPDRIRKESYRGLRKSVVLKDRVLRKSTSESSTQAVYLFVCTRCSRGKLKSTMSKTDVLRGLGRDGRESVQSKETTEMNQENVSAGPDSALTSPNSKAGPELWRLAKVWDFLPTQNIASLRDLPISLPLSWWDRPDTGFRRLVDECYSYLITLGRTDHSDDGTLDVFRCSASHTGIREEIENVSNCFSVNIYKNALRSKGKNRAMAARYDVTSKCIGDVTSFCDVSENVSDVSERSELTAGERKKTLETSRKVAALLTLTKSYSFESLLTSVCMKKNREGNRRLNLVLLEAILSTNGMLDPSQTDLSNLALAFGETPIHLAARARDADVISALLRHGADVGRPWMGLENALEVLLFSPNQIFYGSDEIAALEKCLRVLATGMRSIDFVTLKRREREGYYPLHPDWRKAVTDALRQSWMTEDVPVPSLQHLCRCTLRDSMGYLGHRLSYGLGRLPLPVRLKKFVKLVDL